MDYTKRKPGDSFHFMKVSEKKSVSFTMGEMRSLILKREYFFMIETAALCAAEIKCFFRRGFSLYVTDFFLRGDLEWLRADLMTGK